MNTHDPRAAEAMTKFLGILNDISTLGANGFAHVLDTASPDEMTALVAAADTLRQQIDRVKSPVPQ